MRKGALFTIATCTALLSLSADRGRSRRYGEAAGDFMKDYPDWDGVWEMFTADGRIQSR